MCSTGCLCHKHHTSSCSLIKASKLASSNGRRPWSLRLTLQRCQSLLKCSLCSVELLNLKLPAATATYKVTLTGPRPVTLSYVQPPERAYLSRSDRSGLASSLGFRVLLACSTMCEI